MRLDNVFIGCTIDGEKHLLYRRFGNKNGNKYIYFIDLSNNSRYDIKSVNLDTLIPFRENYTLRDKNLFRRKVLKIYENKG